MFYVKYDHETGTIKAEIHYGNTYTVCPACGTEHQISLTDIPELDLESTVVYCSPCSERRQMERQGIYQWPKK